MREVSQDELSAQAEEEMEQAAVSDNSEYARRGIVYISRIPPGLTPSSLRDIMQQFGQVTRIYCTPQGIFSNNNCYLFVNSWCSHF